MAVLQSVFLGDSLTEGTEFVGGTSSITQGGKGAWWELVADQLANIPGFGPLISSGFRGIWLKLGAESDGEWSAAVGSWTNVASTDAFDRGPYGQGQYSAAGSGATQTWNKPATWRPVVGFALYYADYAAGGNWQYRVDGGTWTNMGQTLNHDGKLCKFYVNAPVTATVDVRAYDGASSAGICIFGIEAFYLPPSTATGCIFHNLAVNGAQLHSLCATTSGDRLAFLDSVQVDPVNGGGAISNRPNTAIVMMHGRDVVLASPSGWGTDLTTLNTRASPLAKLLFMSPFELAQFPDEANSVSPGFSWSDQTSYRDKTKAVAAAFATPVPVLDLYDRYQQMGFGVASGTTVTLSNSQNVALRAAGLLNPLDNGHEMQAGHLDLAPPISWFIRTNLPTRIGPNLNPYTVGKSGIGGPNELGGVGVGTQYPSPSGTAVSVVAGSPTIKSTTKILPSGKAVALSAGSPTIAPGSVARSATGTAVAVTAGAPTIHARTTLSPSGVAVAVSAGMPSIAPGSVTRTATGVAISIAAGSATIHPRNTLTLTGVPVSMVAGAPTIAPGSVSRPSTGVAVAVAAGTPTLHARNTLTPTGLAVSVTAGAPSLKGTSTQTTTGIAIAVTAGAPTVKARNTITPAGAAITLSAGSPTVAPGPMTVTPSGHPIVINAGSLTTQQAGEISAAGVTVVIVPGVPTVHATKTVTVSGLPVAVNAGVPGIRHDRTIVPSGVAVTIAAGSVTAKHNTSIAVTGKAVSMPAGIPSIRGRNVVIVGGVAISATSGMPTFHATATIIVAGVPVVAAPGTISISGGGLPPGEPRLVTVTRRGSLHAGVSVRPKTSGQVAVRPGPTVTVTVTPGGP